MLPWELETVHPLFVHFPIALLSTGLLCDILGTIFGRESLHHAGWWCQVFGMISAVFTIATGFLADTVVGHLADPFPLYDTHGIIQISSSLLFAVLLLWRWKRNSELPEKPLLFIYYIVGVMAVLLQFYGGHLGAKLAGRI